jgi:stage V sporulation protein K
MDEVYSLGNKDGGDSFAKEAIDTINLFLSEHKDEFMMIIAGYKDEIDSCFFKYNEGLRRRFMWYHTIEPYTPTQLRDIFLSKVAQTNWKVAQGVAEAMVQTIRDNPDRFPDHAGSIENLITRMKIKHSKRVLLLPESEKKVLTREDLSQAMDEVNKVPKKQEFMSMYM